MLKLKAAKEAINKYRICLRESPDRLKHRNQSPLIQPFAEGRYS